MRPRVRPQPDRRGSWDFSSPRWATFSLGRASKHDLRVDILEFSAVWPVLFLYLRDVFIISANTCRYIFPRSFAVIKRSEQSSCPEPTKLILLWKFLTSQTISFNFLARSHTWRILKLTAVVSLDERTENVSALNLSPLFFSFHKIPKQNALNLPLSLCQV